MKNKKNSLIENKKNHEFEKNGKSGELGYAEAIHKKETDGFNLYQLKTAESIYEYLIKNIDTHITVEQLSEHFNLSPTTIKRIFKLVYGLPIFRYMRMKRMEMAMEMLSNTDETVLSIAGSLGYDNGSKFARAFHNIVGINPSEFREKNGFEKGLSH